MVANSTKYRQYPQVPSHPRSGSPSDLRPQRGNGAAGGANHRPRHGGFKFFIESSTRCAILPSLFLWGRTLLEGWCFGAPVARQALDWQARHGTTLNMLGGLFASTGELLHPTHQCKNGEQERTSAGSQSRQRGSQSAPARASSARYGSAVICMLGRQVSTADRVPWRPMKSSWHLTFWEVSKQTSNG